MLPFKDTPKVLKAKEDPYKRVAVILEPHEAKVSVVLIANVGSVHTLFKR